MPNNNIATSVDPGSFPARLLALATLQILANSTQFTSVRPVSLSILSHVAARYLELLAQAARAHADYSARTQINAWDLSGVLENLHGPGALSSLQNWCLDNLPKSQSHPNHHSQSQSDDPIDKLADIASNLKGFDHAPSTEPITRLSFLPLTDAEIAALDRAGESDLDDDHPSPSSTSGSSQVDSDLDSLLNKTITISPKLPPSNLHHDNNSPVIQSEQPRPISTTRRSNQDMPSYVPEHFPPFPGLEPPLSPTQDPARLTPEEADKPNNTPPTDSSNHPSSFSNQNPYFFTVPYSRSQLCELHGPFVAPMEPILPSSPDHPESPSRKKARLSSSLEGFLQTYSYLIEEKMTNKSADEPKLRKRNPVRYQFIASDRTEPMPDSLFGLIPVSPIRTNRWSAGWIPHPPCKDGQLLPVPELKSFGHTPLPLPITMPVPIQFPPTSLFHPPQPRIPDLIPRLYQKITQDARGDKFTLINRMTRLGPPSELGNSGEPLLYRVKDINNHSSIGMNPPNENTSIGTSSLSQPKYIEWGFHWPSNDGRDPLPAPKPEFDFRPREFPGMPKTSAEKLRHAQKEKGAGNVPTTTTAAVAAPDVMTQEDDLVKPLGRLSHPISFFPHPPPHPETIQK